MVVVFMLLGIPVAFAFLAANIIGAMIYMGGLNAMPQIVVNAVESVTIFALIPVPAPAPIMGIPSAMFCRSLASTSSLVKAMAAYPFNACSIRTPSIFRSSASGPNGAYMAINFIGSSPLLTVECYTAVGMWTSSPGPISFSNMPDSSSTV